MDGECPRVSIVVPSHDRKHSLDRLLNSIENLNYPNLEVVVVDDFSSQDYRELDRKYGNVRFLYNEAEKLLAESRNVGARAADGDYIFFVDDDNVIERGCVSNLVETFERNVAVGVAAPIMLHLEDERTVWCAGVERDDSSSLTSLRFEGREYSEVPRTLLPSADFPNAFMIDRRVFDEVGGFDSGRFPIHYDEADLCRSISALGYEIYCHTKAVIYHDIPIDDPDNFLRRYHVQNGMRAYYNSRNRILFHRRHAGIRDRIAFFLLYFPMISLYYAIGIASSEDEKKYAILREFFLGIKDGLAGRAGKPK